MKSIIVILIHVLEHLLEHAAGRMGIIKYAHTTNAWLSGGRGTIERMILYERFGKLRMRTRPHHFNIKDMTYWQGRIDRFKEFIRLGKSTNHDLDNLYESKPEKMTFFNLMISQMSKFWIGGPAPWPYAFSPGTVEVVIGNGSMPDARGITFTPFAGGHLFIKWDPTVLYPNEHADDVLQLMLIAGDGSGGIWLPFCTPPVAGICRSDGTAGFDWTVPSSFLKAIPCEVFCAIKFRSGSGTMAGITGNFRFPAGITPITLIA
jgi:hypothetical protein